MKIQVREFMNGHVRISNESVQQAGDVSCQHTLRKREILCRISVVSKYKGRDKKHKTLETEADA